MAKIEFKNELVLQNFVKRACKCFIALAPGLAKPLNFNAYFDFFTFGVLTGKANIALGTKVKQRKFSCAPSVMQPQINAHFVLV